MKVNPNDSHDSYLYTVNRIEPDVAMLDRDGALASIAISAKRIADALEKPQTEDRQRELFVLCPQCAGSGAVSDGDESEDNCDLCATKGFALLTAVVAWEADV
jgi:hypothetical protein